MNLGPNVKADVDELAKLKYDSIEFKNMLIKIIAKINGNDATYSHDNSQLLSFIDDTKLTENLTNFILKRYYARNNI